MIGVNCDPATCSLQYNMSVVKKRCNVMMGPSLIVLSHQWQWSNLAFVGAVTSIFYRMPHLLLAFLLSQYSMLYNSADDKSTALIMRFVMRLITILLIDVGMDSQCACTELIATDIVMYLEKALNNI